VATYYATDTAHQRKINGIIVECPAYNMIGGMALSRQWIIDYADSMITANSSVKYWQNAKTYYNQHPVITNDIFEQHLKYLNQAKGVVYNTTALETQAISIPRGELDAVFKNQLYTIANLSYQGRSVFETMNLTPLLSNIDIPVLLAWGDKDGLLPKDNLAAVYAAEIGAPYITYYPGAFQEAAHLPHGEDAAQMQSDVITFIEAYK
jgi:pimeloyl-ACP methyl ester carboxylesterase